jgi:hypothetical protein
VQKCKCKFLISCYKLDVNVKLDVLSWFFFLEGSLGIVKRKVVPVLNEFSTTPLICMEEWGYSPIILDLDSGWR